MIEMKFWVLEKTDDPKNPHPIWDAITFFIVRAPSAEVARKLASEKAHDEGAEFWLNEQWCKCEEFTFPTLEGEAAVVWEEFHPA